MKKRLYVLVLAAGAGLIGLQQLAGNARIAADRRNQIILADQQGIDTSSAVLNLGDFSAHHMGASVKFELTASYNRSVEKAQAAAQPNVSGQVYSDGQKACASHANSIVQANCVRDYVAKHGGPAPTPQPVVMPDRSKYNYDFKSPGFTFDSAGLSFAATAILVAVGFILL